ncbi:MAG: hypothetical protein GY750_12415 [Lentisphaerae bacterium]|nr:hypothetical protein [Lentisphaerota bacterium]MCP4102216.1 hypothetical protein [Lentisphaerota bacterium]
MFQSKFFFVMIILALLAMIGTLVLQVAEMNQYDLMNSIVERYTGSDKSAVAEKASPASSEKANAKKDKAAKAE